MKNIAQIRAENLVLIIDKQFDGKQIRFAERLGKSPNLISRYVNGKFIGDGMARAMEKAAGRPPNWMDERHPEEFLTTPGKSVTYLSNTKDGAPVLWVAPLLSWKEALAPGEALRMQRAHEEGYPAPPHAGPATFTLRVRGASMEPIVRDDDIIFVDPDVKPAHQKCVVARIGNGAEALLRQYIVEGGKQYLRTANANWPEGVIEIDASVTLIGTVIGRWQDL